MLRMGHCRRSKLPSFLPFFLPHSRSRFLPRPFSSSQPLILVAAAVVFVRHGFTCCALSSHFSPNATSLLNKSVKWGNCASATCPRAVDVFEPLILVRGVPSGVTALLLLPALPILSPLLPSPPPLYPPRDDDTCSVARRVRAPPTPRTRARVLRRGRRRRCRHGRLGFTGWTSLWTDGAILHGLTVKFGEFARNLEHGTEHCTGEIPPTYQEDVEAWDGQPISKHGRSD